MSDDARHVTDNWDRQEKLVLKTLEDLRLSSDAALKMGGELKESFADMRTAFSTMKAEVVGKQAQQQSEIDELKARLEKSNKWLTGTATTLGIALIMFFLEQLVPLMKLAQAVSHK